MPFFQRGGGADRDARHAAEQEQAASLEALVAGGLPLKAQERLRDLRARDGFFTSDLTVNEFALVHAVGVRPVAQVMGSSIYHVGWQQQGAMWGASWQPGGVSQELEALSYAWNDARQRAFARLEQEARLVGADAVIGVRLQSGSHDWAAGSIEYIAVGTAVRIADTEPADSPALSDLSGQEYWQLRQAGYRPLGVVGASTVFYVVPGWSQQRLQSGLFSSWANQELGDFTQGVYDARETALARLTAEAQALNAAGVVGVSLAHSVEEREVGGTGTRRTDLIVTMHVLGTAIAEQRGARSALPITAALDLSAGPSTPHLLGGTR